MTFTEDMRAEDESRWHARDVVTELGYCGIYMRDRRNMTNLDIRFYAYIMRKAYNMLKEQEAVTEYVIDEFQPTCKACGFRPFAGYIPSLEWMRERGFKFCPQCGRAVKWNADGA